ncbi:hypothetical protein ABZ297_26285 [Nonomuraea sp. NPDC005983]
MSAVATTVSALPVGSDTTMDTSQAANPDAMANPEALWHFTF